MMLHATTFQPYSKEQYATLILEHSLEATVMPASPQWMQNCLEGQSSPQMPRHWCPHDSFLQHLLSQGSLLHGAPHGRSHLPCDEWTLIIKVTKDLHTGSRDHIQLCSLLSGDSLASSVGATELVICTCESQLIPCKVVD